ncbi:uncharacterized protein LOC100206390 isoform X8 [Hydra vulgaris]|uniref:Uncharacterized protein LOC100206390 isoform X8 n=1 Tax=Hydra vulgaris TaxID=6087 RepID=A0ABM4C2I7_HYDVU
MLTDNQNVMANLDDAVCNKKYNKTEKQKCKKSLIRTLLYLVPEIMLHSLDVNFPISKNFTSILDIKASLNKHNSILETNIVYSNNSMEKKRIILQAPTKYVSQASLVQKDKQAKSFYWKVIAHLIKMTGAFEDIQSNFYTSLLSFFLFKPKSTSLILSPYGQSNLLSSSDLKCSSKYMQCFYSMLLENGSFLLQTCSFLPDFRIYILSSKVANHIIAIEQRINGLIDEKYSLCPNIFLKKLFNIQASGDYKFCILGCKYVKLCLSLNHAIYLQPLLKLGTKLEKVESKICQLKLECKPDFKIENNIRKNFTIILKWLEMVEKKFLSVKQAENFEIFKDSCLSFSQLVADLQIYANLSTVCYKQLTLLRCHLWCVEHLEEDMKHISDRLEYIKLFSINIQKDFDLYLQCFQHLHNVLQCSAWLKEVLVVMGVKVVFINEEDIAQKLLRIKNLEEIFVSKAAKVDKVIIKGKKLLSKGFLIPFYYNFCLTQLEEEWIRVKQLVKDKIHDSKNFKTNWIIFNQKLNQIIENIGNIEVLFFNLKSMCTFSQATNDDLMKFSLKCISMLLEQANHLNNIYVLHECVLKHKLSNDLNYILRQKLENVFFIKNSLKVDLETYTNILISDCSKRKGKCVLELVNNIPMKIFSSFPATYKAEILRESWVHQELFFRLIQLMKWLERKKMLVYLSDKLYIGNFQNASNYKVFSIKHDIFENSLKLEQKVPIDPMTFNKLDLSTPGEQKFYSCLAEHLEDKICCFSRLKENSEEEVFYSCITNLEQKLPSSCTTKASSSECFQKEKYFKDVIIEYEYIIDEFEVIHIQTIEVCDDEFFAEETKFQLVASKKNNTMIESKEKSRKESKNMFFSLNESQQCVRLAKVHSGMHNSIFNFILKLNESSLPEENTILLKIVNDEMDSFNNQSDYSDISSLKKSKKFLIEIVSTRKYKTIDFYSTYSEMISECGYHTFLLKELPNRTIFRYITNNISARHLVICDQKLKLKESLGKMKDYDLIIPCFISNDCVSRSLDKKLKSMISVWKSNVMKKLKAMPHYQLENKSLKNADAERIFYLNQATLNEVSNTIRLIETNNGLIQKSNILDLRSSDKYLEYITCITEIEELYHICVHRHEKMKFLLESCIHLHSVQQLLLSGPQFWECFKKQADDIAKQIKMFCFFKTNLQNTLVELATFDIFSDFAEGLQEIITTTLLSIDKKLAELKIAKKTVQFNIKLLVYLKEFVEDYLEEIDMSEQYLNVEYEDFRSLTTLKVVLRTVSLAITDHRAKLDKIVCLSKEFKGALPPYESLMLSGFVQSCINKTYEIEDTVIIKNKEISILLEFEEHFKWVAEKGLMMAERLFILCESGCDVNLFIKHLLKYKYNIQCIVKLHAKDTFLCLPERDRFNLDVIFANAKKTFFILADLITKRLYFQGFALYTNNYFFLQRSINYKKNFYNHNLSKVCLMVNNENVINMIKILDSVICNHGYHTDQMATKKIKVRNDIQKNPIVLKLSLFIYFRHNIKSLVSKTQLSWLFKKRNVNDGELRLLHGTTQIISDESINFIDNELIILTEVLELNNKMRDKVKNKLKTFSNGKFLHINEATKLNECLNFSRFDPLFIRNYELLNMRKAKTFQKELELFYTFKTVKCDLINDLITNNFFIIIGSNKIFCELSMLRLFLNNSFDDIRKLFFNFNICAQGKNIKSCDRGKNKQLLYKCKKHVLRSKQDISNDRTLLYGKRIKFDHAKKSLGIAKDRMNEDFDLRLIEKFRFMSPQDSLKRKSLKRFFTLKERFFEEFCATDVFLNKIRIFYKKGIQDLKVTLNRYTTFKQYRNNLQNKVLSAINNIKNVIVESNKYCSSIYLDEKIFFIVHLRYIYLRQTETSEIIERFFSFIKNRLKTFLNDVKSMGLLTAQGFVERYFKDFDDLKDMVNSKKYFLKSISAQIEGISLPKQNSSILFGLLAECDTSLCNTASKMECILQQFDFHRERLIFFHAATDSLFFNFDLIENVLRSISSFESSSNLLKELKKKFNDQFDFINMLLSMSFVVPRTEISQVANKKKKVREKVEMLQFIFIRIEAIYENCVLRSNQKFEKSTKPKSKYFMFKNKCVKNLINGNSPEYGKETQVAQAVADTNDNHAVGVYMNDDADNQAACDKKMPKINALLSESSKCLLFFRRWECEDQHKSIVLDLHENTYGINEERMKYHVKISKSVFYNEKTNRFPNVKNQTHIQKNDISCEKFFLTFECAYKIKHFHSFIKECFLFSPVTENRLINYYAGFTDTCNFSAYRSQPFNDTYSLSIYHRQSHFTKKQKFAKNGFKLKVLNKTFIRQLDPDTLFPITTTCGPYAIKSNCVFEIINSRICLKKHKSKKLDFEEIKNKKELKFSGNLREQFSCGLNSNKYNNIQINELLGTKTPIQKFADGFAADVVCIQAWLLQNESIFRKENFLNEVNKLLHLYRSRKDGNTYVHHLLKNKFSILTELPGIKQEHCNVSLTELPGIKQEQVQCFIDGVLQWNEILNISNKESLSEKQKIFLNQVINYIGIDLSKMLELEANLNNVSLKRSMRDILSQAEKLNRVVDSLSLGDKIALGTVQEVCIVKEAIINASLAFTELLKCNDSLYMRRHKIEHVDCYKEYATQSNSVILPHCCTLEISQRACESELKDVSCNNPLMQEDLEIVQNQCKNEITKFFEIEDIPDATDHYLVQHTKERLSSIDNELDITFGTDLEEDFFFYDFEDKIILQDTSIEKVFSDDSEFLCSPNKKQIIDEGDSISFYSSNCNKHFNLRYKLDFDNCEKKVNKNDARRSSTRKECLANSLFESIANSFEETSFESAFKVGALFDNSHELIFQTNEDFEPMGIFEPDLSDCSNARFNIEKLPPYSLQPSSGKEINKMHYSERTNKLLRSAQDQLYENLSTCLSDGATEFDVFEKISDENNNTKIEKYGKLKCSIESLNAELKEFFKTLEDGNISYLPNFCQSWSIISSLYRQVSNSKHEFSAKSKKCGTKDLQKMLHSIEQNLFEACVLCESHLLPMVAGIYSNLIVISASFEQIEDQFQTYDTLFVVEKDEINNIVKFNENVQKYIDNALILVNIWRQLEIHEVIFDKIIGSVLFLCYRIDSLLENLLSKQLFVEDEYMQNVQDLHAEVAYISSLSVCELSETLLESHFKQLFRLQSRVELHKNLDLAPEMLLTIQRALEAIKLNIHKNRDHPSSAPSSPAQQKLINVKPQSHDLADFKGYKGKSRRNTPLNEKKNYNNAIHTKNGVSSFHFKPFYIPNDDYEMNCVLVENFCDDSEASCNSKNNGLLLNDSSNVSWASFVNIVENSESKFSEPSSFSDSLETLDAPLSLDKGVSITPLTEINSENIPYTVECTDISLDWDFVDDVDSFQINLSTSENQKSQSFENQKQFLPSLSLDLSEIKFKCHEQEVLPDSLYTLKTCQVIMEPDDDVNTKGETLPASYSVKSLNKPFKSFNQKSNETSTHSLEVSEHFKPNKETNCYVINHDHSEIEVRSFEVATITFVEDVLASSVLNVVNLKPDMTGSLINAEPDGPLENANLVESFKTNETLNLIQDESLISFNSLLPHTCPIDIFLKLPELEQTVNEEKNSEETDTYKVEETTLKNHIQSADTILTVESADAILTVENNHLSTKVIEVIDDSNHKDFDKILLAQMYNQVSQPLSPKLVSELPDSVSFHPDNLVVQSCKFSIISNEFSEPTESAVVSNDFSEPTKSVIINCLQTHKSCLNKSKESQKSRDFSILEELEDSLSNEVVGIKSEVSSNIDGKPIFYANSVDSICVDECNTECGDDLGRPLILPSLNQSVSRIENLKHAKVNINVIAMDFTVSCSADTIATPYVSSYNITDQDMNLYVELTKAEEMQEIDQLFKNATLELQNSLNTSMKCIPDSAEEQSTALQYKYESLTLPRASSPISMANCLVKTVQTKEILNNFEDFEDERSFLSTNDSSFYVSLLMKQEIGYPIDNNFADQPYKNLADPMLNEFEQKAQICMESMIHISNMMSIQSQNEVDDENYFMTKLKLLSYFGFQQSNNDSLNIIGKQIQEAYGVELKDRIQEKLDVVNIYWKDLQDKAIYVECMNSKGLRSAQDEDVSNQLSNKRVPSNDRTLNEFNGFAESWQQVDDYQIQFAKIFFLLTSYNNRLAIENIEREEKTRTETDVEKLKNDYYSAQYLIFDMCSQVSLLEKLGQIYHEIESPSDLLKYHHTHIFDFWEHILHKVASKTEELYKFLKTESRQKELSNNHDLCRRWLFELESCLNDTKDLLLLQPSDFKCETIKKTFAYLAKTLETNLRMVKLITLNQSANVDKCSDLYLDVIHIMQFDPNIVNTLETQMSQNKFIPSIISSPEFFILSNCRNQKYSLVHGISFFEKEMESFLTYLSEIIKTVEAAQVDIASDIASNSTTIIANITRFQTFLQNIKIKELPLKHVYFELQKLNPELDERYAKMIEKSEKAYQKCLAILQTLVCVFLLIKSVNKQQKHLITWLLKFEKHLEYLISKPERCIDDAMRKLVNISNIARRFHVKSATKNKAIEDTNRLSDLRNDANKQDFVFKISDDWNRIEKLLEKEKNRLDSLTSNWKELKFLAQNLEQDVARFLLTVDTSIEHITVEHITLERELLMKVKKQLRKKEKVREQLKVLREKIVTHILENSCSVIDERLSAIDSMWFELQSKISDRLRILSDVKNKIEWIEISEAMREVTKCISSSEELMEIYASPISLAPREIEEGLLLLSDSLIKLEKVQPIIHRLDNYDILLMKDNFHEQFILINDKYELLCKNINERLNLLKIYLENIRAHENFIIECEKQLDELNTVIDKIKHLTFTDTYNDEYKEQLKITDEAIRNISNRIHDVESETENRIITDFTRARINVLNDRLKSSKLKFLEIDAKAKSYSEYGTLNNELSNVEDFLNESKLFLSSLMGANIYDLPFLSKRFKEIQRELPRKLAYLENLKEKLTSTEHSDTGNNLLFLNETLTDEMRKFGVLLDKKQNDFEIAVSSIRQFELDYNELEKWLNEKEMEYDSLLKHAHLSSDIDKVIDSCKKLQADLPVFSTFSSSMTSLLSNNNLSSSFAEISLNQLNVRFDVLQEQTNLLCKKFCQIKQNYSSIIKLFEKTSSFVESCKAQTLDYEEYSFSVQSNLPQCIEMQKELQEILKLHDLDSYIEVQASTCLEKIETTYSQLTKELLIIEQVNKLLTSFEVEFKKVLADIELLNELIQKNHSIDKVQDLKENVNRKSESIHEVNKNIMNLIRDAIWASDIRCRQDTCMSSLIKKLNQILISDEQNNKQHLEHLIDADESAKTILIWLEDAEAKLIDMGNRIKLSNVAILKACFEELKNLKSEKLQHQKIYNDLMRQLNDTHESTELEKINPVISIQGLWSKVEKLISRCFDDIKEVLLIWAEYTETIKGLIFWLRSSENIIKQPLHKLSAKQLNNEFFVLQKISNEYDARHASQTTLKPLVARLSKLTLHEDKLLLKQQLTCFNQLWAATKSSLNKKKVEIEKLIDWLKSFSHQKKIILAWLEEVENSIFLSVSPDKHRGGTLQINKSDVIRYDKVREQLKLIAVKIISHAPACEFSEDINCFTVELDNRWRSLCEKLGLAYQGVEEALFLLKLLEEMLNMLEKWLHNITKRIEQIELYTCNIDSMHIYIQNLEVMINEFFNREKDFVSVCELCKKIQKSPEACSYAEDLKVLLECSEGFKIKWHGIREKCRMYKTILENREDVYRQWENTADTIKVWLVQRTINNSTIANVQTYDTDNYRVLDLFNQLKNCRNYLLRNNCDNSSLKISKTTEEISESLYCVNSLYLTFQCSSNDINNNISNSDNKCQDNYVKYLKTEQEVENWLCEIEIQMIQLRPYIFEQDEKALFDIRRIKDEMEKKSSIVEELNLQTETINGFVEENVMEINHRYQKALKDLKLWISNYDNDPDLTS